VDRNGVPISGDIRLLKLFAFQMMGVRALRAMRAARATLATAYEAESRPLDRVLAELIEHRRAVLYDDTGTEAKAWLEGSRRSGIGRRVAKRAPEGLYANLSADSHADPRPLARLLDANAGVMAIEPRRTSPTRASLLMHAGFARDQAVTIATFAGLVLSDVSAIDDAIALGGSDLTRRAPVGRGKAAEPLWCPLLGAHRDQTPNPRARAQSRACSAIRARARLT
jgi:hypothetical protein